MKRLNLITLSMIGLLLPSLAGAKSVLPQDWEPWKREALRFDNNEKGAILDCNYQNSASKRTLRVSITTRKPDLESGKRRVKSFADPKYLAVMNSFPGAYNRTWNKDGADFVFESRKGAATRISVVHPRFVLYLSEAGVDKDETAKLISKFDVNAIASWAKTPYNPDSSERKEPIVGAGGEDEEEDMEESNTAEEVDENNQVAHKKLSDWLPVVEGWKKTIEKTVGEAAAAVYEADDGTKVKLRLSAIKSEVQAILPMINTLSASPMIMQHQSKRGSYKLSIGASGSFKTLFKFSKNIGAKKSTITSTNGTLSAHLSAKRKKDEQLKTIFAAIDLEGLGKAYTAK